MRRGLYRPIGSSQAVPLASDPVYSAAMQASTTRPRRTPLIATLLTIIALLSGGSFLAEAKRARKAPAADTADCKKDTDCVVVPDDCCSCNQGGKQHAIPKKEKEAYEKARKKRCGGTACTEMMSEDQSCSKHAFCGAGICELEDPPAKAP